LKQDPGYSFSIGLEEPDAVTLFGDDTTATATATASHHSARVYPWLSPGWVPNRTVL